MKNTTPPHDKIVDFIKKQQFSLDSKWPSLLLCLHSHQFNEHLSALQLAAFSTLLTETLNITSFTDELLQEVFKK